MKILSMNFSRVELNIWNIPQIEKKRVKLDYAFTGNAQIFMFLCLNYQIANYALLQSLFVTEFLVTFAKILPSLFDKDLLANFT